MIIQSKIQFKIVQYNDIQNIIDLFKLVFNKSISKDFYVWRYKDNKKFNCFIAKTEDKVIAHIGFVKYHLNSTDLIFSRHSSMVHRKFRRNRIYTKLLEWGIQKLEPNFGILIWPNSINYRVQKKQNLKIKNIEKKYLFHKNILTKRKNQENDFFLKRNIETDRLKQCLKNNNTKSIILKDYKFFKKRYLLYDNENLFYFFKKYSYKLSDLLIVKKLIIQNTINYYAIDYYGDFKNYNLMIEQFIHYLSINKKNNEIIQFKIFLTNNFYVKELKHLALKKSLKKMLNICIINPEIRLYKSMKDYNFFLGDTDALIETNKNF